MHSKFCLSLTWGIVFSAEAWMCLGSALVIFSLRSLFSSGISPVFCAMNPWSSAMLFCFHFHSWVAFLVRVGASYQITDFGGLKRQTKYFSFSITWALLCSNMDTSMSFFGTLGLLGILS